MFRRKIIYLLRRRIEKSGKGDAATKASFFLMGNQSTQNRQWVKGTAYLVSEVVFLLWLIFSGTSALRMLSNLGAVKTKQVVFDQAQRGLYHETAR